MMSSVRLTHGDCPCLLQLFGRVHEEGCFDQTQLLKFFDLLQRGMGESVPAKQHIGMVPIDAHMPPVGGVLMPLRRLYIPHMRNTGVSTSGVGLRRLNSATIASITAGSRNG